MSQTKEFYHEEIARIYGSAAERYDYECAYEIGELSAEEIAELEEDQREEIARANAAEIDAMNRRKAADLKARKLAIQRRLDEINAEIEQAGELDRAVREIQRRISIPAKREDVEPVVREFMGWRETLVNLGSAEFWKRLALFDTLI